MTTPRRGYYDLLGIVESNRELQRDLERQGITGTGGIITCPYDGSILLYREKDGLWNCPMGDYTSPNGPQGVQP